MISLTKAAQSSMRVLRRENRRQVKQPEAHDASQPKKRFARFRRAASKGASHQKRHVTQAIATPTPVAPAAPSAPPSVPRGRNMRTAVNMIKQHVSETLERLLGSLKSTKSKLTTAVAKHAKLAQQADGVADLVDVADGVVDSAREQAATAAAAVGMLEHLEGQLLAKVKELRKSAGNTAELQEMERDLRLQHETILQQKQQVQQWYNNSSQAKAVAVRVAAAVDQAQAAASKAAAEVAAAAAALYEAQRAAAAAKQMIMQAVARAHLEDYRHESGERLEEEELVLEPRGSKEVVVLGRVSLAEKLRMEQAEVWQEMPAELQEAYGHDAVAPQRQDYEAARNLAQDASTRREQVAKMAEEVAAHATSAGSPLSMLTNRYVEQQMENEREWREELETKVRYLSSRLAWVRMAASQAAADDLPWTARSALPAVEVESNPAVVGAIEALNTAKADLMALDRKMGRLDCTSRLQHLYWEATGKLVADGESVPNVAAQLMKDAVLSEIRAYRSVNFAQQALQQACEAVQDGQREAAGEGKASPEHSLSRLGLEPRRLQYFLQYYMDTLPKRLSAPRPRPTRPAAPRTRPAPSASHPDPGVVNLNGTFNGSSLALNGTSSTVGLNGTSNGATSNGRSTNGVTIGVTNGVTQHAKPPGSPRTVSADIERVRSVLQTFIESENVVAEPPSPSASPSATSHPSFDRPGRSRNGVVPMPPSPSSRSSATPHPSFDRPGRSRTGLAPMPCSPSSRPSATPHPSFDRPGRSRVSFPDAVVSAPSTSLSSVVELDSAMLESVRTRLALAQLLERGDSHVVRELAASQFAADERREEVADVADVGAVLVSSGTSDQEDPASFSVEGMGASAGDPVERLRLWYAMQYMLERAQGAAAKVAAAQVVEPAASMDSTEARSPLQAVPLASPQASTPLAAPTPPAAPLPPLPTVPAIKVGSFALTDLSDEEEEGLAPSPVGIPRQETFSLSPPSSPRSVPREETYTLSPPGSPRASFEPPAAAVATSSTPSSTPAPVTSAPAISPMAVAAPAAPTPTPTPTPTLTPTPTPTPTLTLTPTPTLTLSPAAPARTPSAPAAASRPAAVSQLAAAAVAPAVAAASIARPSLRRQVPMPSLAQLRRTFQQRGELSGSVFALTLASWGGAVATHMDQAGGITAVYMAAAAAALAAISPRSPPPPPGPPGPPPPRRQQPVSAQVEPEVAEVKPELVESPVPVPEPALVRAEASEPVEAAQLAAAAAVAAAPSASATGLVLGAEVAAVAPSTTQHTQHVPAAESAAPAAADAAVPVLAAVSAAAPAVPAATPAMAAPVPSTVAVVQWLVQERGELTGAVLALGLGSWGTMVGYHMESAPLINSLYMALGIGALGWLGTLSPATLAPIKAVDQGAAATAAAAAAAPLQGLGVPSLPMANLVQDLKSGRLPGEFSAAVLTLTVASWGAAVGFHASHAALISTVYMAAGVIGWAALAAAPPAPTPAAAVPAAAAAAPAAAAVVAGRLVTPPMPAAPASQEPTPDSALTSSTAAAAAAAPTPLPAAPPSPAAPQPPQGDESRPGSWWQDLKGRLTAGTGAKWADLAAPLLSLGAVARGCFGANIQAQW